MRGPYGLGVYSLLVYLFVPLGAGSAFALDISGASTLQPVVSQLMPRWAQQGGEPITLTGGGSSIGISRVLSGKSQIGMVSRALQEPEKALLKERVVAIDALAIITHESNPVTGLSRAQLVDLYSGEIGNWRGVGGWDRKVILVSKEIGRSALEAFERYTGLMSPERNGSDQPIISKKAYVTGSNLEALTLVGGLSDAIGYASVGAARALIAAGMPVKVIALDGIDPSDDDINAKRYPIVNSLHFVYLQETPTIKAFLDLVLDAQGQKAVQSLGFLPVGR
jgi:phosphate transport system substrate-binding protein